MAMLIDRRYNPFRDFEDINRSFFGDNGLAEFKTDIRDTGDAYQMECDLPGFKKEDISLSLNDNMLTIKAERHSDFEDQDKKGSYLRCERNYGSYTRSFDVTGVDTNKIHASYNNGVLCIMLPKYVKQSDDPHAIAIE
ncbi:MAG: Hsp20/alpha crystallin family protein [Gemmiger sp.]|uniref:Hsp20/alpha crystallin family protein n=1 Tax=Gemmiger sp. TaxID=2049027 RepID=UPI002E76EEFE|nr:Hsp20/alpha crystallin family protein [Gemmiger sp.]MEE0802060.1 Hsp20/alpha crystallin family protein [Gemmiger sp.]